MKKKLINKNTNTGYDPKVKLMQQHGMSYDQACLQQVAKYTGFEDITPPDMYIWVKNVEKEWDALSSILTMGCWIQRCVISTCDKHFYRSKKRAPGIKKVVQRMNTIRQFKRVAPSISLTLFQDTIKYAIFNWFKYNTGELTKAELQKRSECMIWWCKKTEELDINAHKQEIKIPSLSVKTPNELFTIKTENLKSRTSYKSVKLRIDPETTNKLELHVTHNDEVQNERPHLAMVSEAVGIKNYWGKQGTPTETKEVEYTVDLTELFE